MAAPSAVSREEAGQGFFRIFPRSKKSAEVTRQVRAGVAADTSSWTRAACEVEEAAPMSSSGPAVQQLSMEAAVAFDVVEYVKCLSRWWGAGGWPPKTGKVTWRPDRAVAMAGLAVVVVGVSGILQFRFQQSFEFIIVPQIQFIVRVLDIAVMPQSLECTVSNCAGDRAAPTGAVLGMVVDTPVVVQRQVPWQGKEVKTMEVPQLRIVVVVVDNPVVAQRNNIWKFLCIPQERVQHRRVDRGVPVRQIMAKVEVIQPGGDQQF